MSSSEQMIVKLQEANHRLLQENQALLKGLHRYHRLMIIGRIINAIIFIGLAFGAYVFLQPLVQNLENTYDDIKTRFEIFDN